MSTSSLSPTSLVLLSLAGERDWERRATLALRSVLLGLLLLLLSPLAELGLRLLRLEVDLLFLLSSLSFSLPLSLEVLRLLCRDLDLRGLDTDLGCCFRLLDREEDLPLARLLFASRSPELPPLSLRDFLSLRFSSDEAPTFFSFSLLLSLSLFETFGMLKFVSKDLK